MEPSQYLDHDRVALHRLLWPLGADGEDGILLLLRLPESTMLLWCHRSSGAALTALKSPLLPPSMRDAAKMLYRLLCCRMLIVDRAAAEQGALIGDTLFVDATAVTSWEASRLFVTLFSCRSVCYVGAVLCSYPVVSARSLSRAGGGSLAMSGRALKAVLG